MSAETERDVPISPEALERFRKDVEEYQRPPVRSDSISVLDELDRRGRQIERLHSAAVLLGENSILCRENEKLSETLDFAIQRGQQRIAEMRAERDEALGLLRELVELENEPHPHGHGAEECGAWQDDYRGRFDSAWARADAFVERARQGDET